MKLVLKSCFLDLAKKVSQTGRLLPRAMVVFDHHLPN
jgi:hypothetical protein